MSGLQEYKFTLLTMRSREVDHVSIQAMDDGDAYEQVMESHPGRLIIHSEAVNGFSVVSTGLNMSGRQEDAIELFNQLTGRSFLGKLDFQEWSDTMNRSLRIKGYSAMFGDKVRLISKGMIIKTGKVGQAFLV